ncbi:MAG: hypothetical protein QIT35_gp34 [Methanophagales virus PBV299]|uniref:Uncharacterized protein n=1 Tax=Methanophagales virus PBV299 TaxID=2987730 RepID=A0ABY6GNA7_9CAUD|nr:MAG: hypothetical protein QIT35_gp34 [Methanophagales virus PBV299]UYL64830.1 MAG: hypothetical protein OFDIEDLO_00034 [Methanophagales virus PBV299]
MGPLKLRVEVVLTVRKNDTIVEYDRKEFIIGGEDAGEYDNLA